MMFKSERKDVARIMRRLYKQRLTTSSGGNVSMKNSDGYIFITASQTDKSCIKYKDIIVFDSELNNLTPELKPSMESEMHINIYKMRPDISAIVHSHPIYASTFAIIDTKFYSSLTGEARYVLGEVAEIDYELMGTKKLAELSANKLKNSNVGIMKNHGAITLGKNLFEAYDRMEVLEFSANMYFNVLLLNSNVNLLSVNEVEKIDRLKNI